MPRYEYTFDVLNPLKTPVAQAQNAKIFGNFKVVRGVEVTELSLAEMCVENYDTQHNGGDGLRAVIEIAYDLDLPEGQNCWVTLRPDLDALGFMAIMNLRAKGIEFTPEMFTRIEEVANADKFVRGKWAGPKALPSRENPWPEEASSAESNQNLAAIAKAVADFKVPMETRVGWMENWLLTGEEPEGYREAVEKERLELIEALEKCEIKVTLLFEGRVALVESTHRAATMIGYAFAPVVIAVSRGFRFNGGEPHTKWTICVFQQGHYANIPQIKKDLNFIEFGPDWEILKVSMWGGSDSIVGSPQGKS